MNYSRKAASKKQKHVTSKTSHQNKRVGVRLFKAFLLCVLLIGVAAVIGAGIFVKKVIDNAPDTTPANVKPKKFTTFVYAEDGTTELERFNMEGSNRVYRSIDQIPEDLQHAFVAIEDERFYKHNGVDLQGVVRAGIKGITSGSFSEGASTITQQLLKNTIFDFTSEKTFMDRLERKIQEQYLALQIEKQMDKETILENYMNTVNLGQNSLGVQTASKRYFNKDVSELTLSESAVIAGITQNPTGYNPITNPDANKKRQVQVLDHMLKAEYITQEAYDEAVADDVYARIQSVNNEIGTDPPTTYFIDAASQQIIKDLEDQLSYSKTQAYNTVYSGGLSIITTQNPGIQQICDEEMNNPANYPALVEYGLDYALTVTRADGSIENFGSEHVKQYAEAGGKPFGLLYSSLEEAQAYIVAFRATIAREGDEYDEYYNLAPQPQASLTIMDQHTGEIKAMVGGRGEKPTSLSLNRAYTGSKRQPGSTFKIVTAYAPALDSAGMTLATIEQDTPYTKSDGQPLKNATGTFSGSVTLRTAINESMNTVAVRVVNTLTPQVGIDYAKKLGITTLIETPTDYGNGLHSDLIELLPLGALTEGVYNYQMCGAYAAIANNGTYIKPTLYKQVLDHDGNVLLDGTGETSQAIKDSTAYLLTSAMETVVTQGTGKEYQLDNMPVAGKTGTTDDQIDFWFVGFTPYYTCAVWIGYDMNKPVAYNFNSNIWRGVMSRVHAGLERKEFEKPASVEQLSICRTTGKLARSWCPTITEYFALDSAPKETCPGHGSSNSWNQPYDNSTNTSDNSTNTENSTDQTDPNAETNPEPTPEEPTPEPTPETPTPEPAPEGGE
ncbi:penicillin-binding protein 1A [Aequitasia blattaphilus]|uniref:Penicillin-binding protein 1A n=1 Tax=Aequitasia blattaphilus TaxID=2949332 RepID=A0ABT1E6Q7_9FIRM|nr:transglycosylase domain-containing protein [Aequitasia blattaphilus]MCP1101448.1 transglycosylase domain-containing protein [Aequitasia blattaphilus]MCR8614088.1 transglycosylase domain-containing protein [Aequitasia blattaphilus]